MSGNLRGEIAAALFRWNTPTEPYFVISGRLGEAEHGQDEDPYLPIADAILPIVQRREAEARREALEEAVKHLRRVCDAMRPFGTGDVRHDRAFDNGYLSALDVMQRYASEAKP